MMTHANLSIAANLTPRLKENCVTMSTSGQPLVHHRSFLSVTEEGFKLPFFAFPETAAFKDNRSALEHPEIVENALEKLCQSGRVIQCANPPPPQKKKCCQPPFTICAGQR